MTNIFSHHCLKAAIDFSNCPKILFQAPGEAIQIAIPIILLYTPNLYEIQLPKTSGIIPIVLKFDLDNKISNFEYIYCDHMTE